MSKGNSVFIFLINLMIEFVKILIQTQGSYPGLIGLLDLFQETVSGKEDWNPRQMREPWPQDGS